MKLMVVKVLLRAVPRANMVSVVDEVEKQRKRRELIDLVAQIIAVDFDTEDQHDAAVLKLQAAVADPRVVGYIYYWDRNGFDSEPTAAEVVDRAMGYKPFVL